MTNIKVTRNYIVALFFLLLLPGCVKVNPQISEEEIRPDINRTFGDYTMTKNTPKMTFTELKNKTAEFLDSVRFLEKECFIFYPEGLEDDRETLCFQGTNLVEDIKANFTSGGLNDYDDITFANSRIKQIQTETDEICSHSIEDICWQTENSVEDLETFFELDSKMYFSYNETAAFYIDGDYKGFGRSFGVNKRDIINGTWVCLDVDMDGFCDLSYEIEDYEVWLYPSMTLIGEKDCSSKYIRPDLVDDYIWRVPKTSVSEYASANEVWSWLRDYMNYKKDSILFGLDDYWALPNETLYKRLGDCEDWTSTFLSILERVSPDAKCYGIYAGIPSGHVFVLCKFDDYDRYTIYDQGWKMDKFGSAAYLLRDYAMSWGIDEITIYEVFNSTNCWGFLSNDQFVEWIEAQ